METLISDTGRKKIVIIDTLNFRTEKKCIDQFFSIVNGGRKLIAFDVLSPLLTDKGYWYALGQSYKSELWPDHWFDMTDKERFFTASRPCREMLMNRAERKYLSSLPEKVLLHRTMTEKEWDSKEFGLSWTLDIKVAENSFFGSKWDYEFNNYRLDVHSLEVQRSQIIAYFNRDGEREIIYKHYKNGELPDIF